MTSTLTILGDVSRGITGSHLSFYSSPGLEWSAEELRQVRSIREEGSRDGGDLCWYCQHLIEYQGDDKVQHQPGYKALAASASTCSLCFFVLLSLDCGIPNFLMHEEWTKRNEGLPLQVVVDKIEVFSVPISSSIGRSLRRFFVTWSGTGFHWAGDVMGIHDHRCEELPKRAIWTNEDGTNFNARFPVIESWFDQCLNCHSACTQISDPILPTRILDIGSIQSGSNIRLVAPRGMKAKYAALSHCWGGLKPLTTTTETIFSRMQTIEKFELPKTFQHVVEILWKLRIQYLWVDTLCIIQNDKEDWERESANMNKIYKDAYVCIAATAARDCNAGLIQPYVPSIQGSSKDSNEWTSAIRVSGLHSRQPTLPLEQRAWTLQEDILARRVLYFGQGQLSWRCKSSAASEDGLLDGLLYEESDYMRLRKAVSELSPNNPTETHNIWRRLVETYSRRKATFDTDRVAALAGITYHFQELLRDEPVLGMWRYNLVVGMLWQTQAHAVRSTLASIPSWSWLSIIGAIHYDQQWTRLGAQHDYYLDPMLAICSINITWSSVPFTSSLKRADIVVRGLLLQARARIRDTTFSQSVHLYSLGGETSATVGDGLLDIEPAESLADQITCLHVATITSYDTSRHSSQHGVYNVLLLQPVSAGAGTYVRVGLGRLNSAIEVGVVDIVAFKKNFPSSREATITIV